MNILSNSALSVKVGNAGEVTVDVTKLPDVSLSYLIEYGLKQSLNDSRSAVKDGDEALQTVLKKLDALYAGTIRVAGTRETDPVKAEARKLAKARIDAAMRKAGKKVTEENKEAYQAAITKTMADPAIVQAATENVERAKGLSVDDDILAGL